MLPTSRKRLEALDNLLKSTGRKDLNILEVGSLHGESAKVLGKYGKVTCVDLWEFGTEEFKKNTAGLDIEMIQGSSLDILAELPPESFDLIYIDGNHTYDYVVEDIRNSKTLIRSGGYICGDDLEKQIWPIAFFSNDYDKAIRHKDVDYFEGIHWGVSLAVVEELGEVECINGFWFKKI